MAIDEDVLDQLLAGRDLQELFAKDGLLDELKKALSERMLTAERDDHLESQSAGPQATEGQRAMDRRNGSSRKTMLTGTWPLDACYPRRLLSARLLRRDPGEDQGRRVRAQQACPEPVEGAVYIAPGILPDGTKDILGIWIEQTEGETFWLGVMNELDNRGVADILIAVVDGLKGFPEAINAVFPETVVQTCSRPASST